MQDFMHLSTLPSSSKISSQLSAPKQMVFCDFDGPIADVSERYYTTYMLALAATQAEYAEQGRQLPIRRLTKAQFWYMKQNRIPDTTIADWSGLLGDEADNFLGRVCDIVNRPDLLHLDQVQPGTMAALLALHNAGIRVIIVTLRQAAQVLDFLHRQGLATLVSQIYGADDTTIAYANRTEHKIARLQDAIADQQRLGFNTADSWMIGDTEADIGAGQAMNLPTVALTCGIRSALYLKGFSPDVVYRDLYAAVENFSIGIRQPFNWK